MKLYHWMMWIWLTLMGVGVIFFAYEWDGAMKKAMSHKPPIEDVMRGY